jgi:hypothetical protein
MHRVRRGQHDSDQGCADPVRLLRGDQMTKSAPRYKRTAELLARGMTRKQAAVALGTSTACVRADLTTARRCGLPVPQPRRSAYGWCLNERYLGRLQVGGAQHLLDALGLDLVQRIVAECPPGVTLMEWIGGIVKDAMCDDE